MKTRRRRRWEGVLFMGCALAASAAMLALQHRQVSHYVETVSSRVDTESSQATGSALRQPDADKVVYLTFDDGPSSLTEEYLDVLRKHQIHATFFLIGQQAEELPEIVQRELQEGHEVGIHTYSHESDEIYQSCDAYYEDVQKVAALCKSRFQYQPSLWRFPWGSANAYISAYREEIIARLCAEGMEYVDWNVSAEDSVGSPTTASILQNIRKDCFRVKAPVVLMHDSGCNRATLDSLESVIEMFEKAGYTFGTLSDRQESCHFGCQ